MALTCCALLPMVGCSSDSGAPRPGEVRIDTDLEIRLRYAPAAELLVGSPENEIGRDEDERRLAVELTRGFWTMESEVTQGLWQEVTGSNPALFEACGANCPVERVSWYDAAAFANRLSDRVALEPCYRLIGCRGTFGGSCAEEEDWCNGDFVCERVELESLDCTGYRLPTEAEWEHAARAGTETAAWRGDFRIEGLNNAPALGELAWYGGNSNVDYTPAWDCSDWPEKEVPSTSCGTHPVGLKVPNPWGLSDVLGNVWEWVWDRYGAYPEGPVTDPLGPEEGSYRVRRGCSWASIPRHCRAADRSDDSPVDRDRNWGFRLVRSAGSAP